jgi:putative DNA primase/helicase
VNAQGVIWQNAAPAINHRYLELKAINPHGARLHKGLLVIPMRDDSGAVCSLQFIDSVGEKKYLTGGRVRGCFFVTGKPDGVLCIVEGFAKLVPRSARQPGMP